MKVARLRSLIQIASFSLLTYGGYFGLKLGHFLPCFSCPYVHGCSGHCYLMALQGPHWGFELPFRHYLSVWGLRILEMLLGFFVLVIFFSKAWCGWICPFGTLQDWITSLRKKFSIRESQFSWNFRDRLKPIKYIFLVLLIVIPVFIANARLHEDFGLPFCQICPAKLLMPLFEANFENLTVNFTNAITTTMTVLSVILAGSILIGMIFKDRFFCVFCPMLALISLFQKIGFVKLKKEVDACTDCGNCQRVCPVNIRKVHLESVKKNVLTQDCMLCLKCVEACPQNKALSVKFLNKVLFSSSRKYVSKYKKGN